MSKTKKSILIYLDNYPMLTELPPEQRGWLFTALLDYGRRLSEDSGARLETVMKEFPQLSSEARLACGFMAANIRRDTQRWLSRQQYKGRGGRSGPERKAQEDMERTRRLMEQLKAEQ